jgi:hypothetical protein
MKVEINNVDTINGHPASPNDFEVIIDGEFWGWVSGPEKGQRTGRKTAWMALPGEVAEDGNKIAAPFACWNTGHPNAHAAILAAM